MVKPAATPAFRRFLAHPIFDPLRPWLDELGPEPAHDALNAAAERTGLRTASGRPVRFVAPGGADPYYEVHLYESGEVQTRPGNRHDLFNALCWLTFPRTKARINALHAAAIPQEGGQRGRLRDLLTIFDEGGALVVCADDSLNRLIREFRWRELFWEQRARVLTGMRFLVLGHATLEQALEPRPGITCKALFIDPAGDADAQAAAWLGALPADASPRLLAPLPVFGYPGWLPETERAEFYGDSRFFRPRGSDAGVTQA
ncbi:MAG: DUF3025 domain-containing protein [Burkholderiales bacterium]